MSSVPAQDSPPPSRRARREAERAVERATGEIPVAPSAVAPEAASVAPAPSDGVPSGPPAGRRSAAPEPLGHAPEPVPEDDAPNPAATSRAGRNLPAAIGVGVALVALVLAALLIPIAGEPWGFVGLATVAACLGVWEFARAVGHRGIVVPALPVLVGTVGILLSAYLLGTEALLTAFVLTAGGVLVWRVLDGGGLTAMRDVTAGIFAAAYIPFLAGFVMLMLRQPQGHWWVIVFIALCVANDTGGYIAGVLFGKHPMAPTVSPKKSWEGLAGSLLLATAAGIPGAVFLLHQAWWLGPVLAAAAVLAATAGDLSESLLKRDLGVKDMGHLLPGHGGVLDRVDSILIAAPVVFTTMYLTFGS